MDQEKLRTILQIGETIAVEFKRCSNRIENDVYQSVCAFLNRFGGDIYLGVEDNGTVCGVPENAAGDIFSIPQITCDAAHIHREVVEKYRTTTRNE